jgi:hypothetical protein
MQPARIRKLANVASELSKTNNYESAFALRWIAYEGLLRRAAIKALWMRGANVKESESVIMRIHHDPTTILAKCCGFSIDLSTDRYYPILKRIRDRIHFRNLLFHQLNVGSKSQLQLLSDILSLTLSDPKTAFGNVAVRIAGLNSPMRLGNPLADLRKLKRSPLSKRKAVRELFEYKKEELENLPMLPDLTEDEVLRLFNPFQESIKTSVASVNPQLTKEEIKRRVAAWKLSLKKPNVNAA